MNLSKLALATIAAYASLGLAMPVNTNSTEVNQRSCWFICFVYEPICPRGWHKERQNDV
ncbi:uncharacterized protein BDW43DRAFT_317185 [Aspergillus alliaceus]|nr:uncharacterized protein BDW43DRAFT_317185 [Aspergillus alliaceus]KAB8227070.1 hypothetical protein BDW43DRAFT_317185 [Aspergillus alliaceus]